MHEHGLEAIHDHEHEIFGNFGRSAPAGGNGALRQQIGALMQHALKPDEELLQPRHGSA
jgi:hypothetical protein